MVWLAAPPENGHLDSAVVVLFRGYLEWTDLFREALIYRITLE